MTVAIDAIVRASLVLAVGLGATRLLARQSAALRHALLAASLAAAALTPVLGLMLPTWSLDLPAAETPSPDARLAATAWGGGDGPAIEPGPPPAAPHRPPVAAVAGLVWLIGAAGSLGALGIALGRLARLTSRGRPSEHVRWTRLLREASGGRVSRRPVRLLLTRELNIPATWGVVRPCILLPFEAEHWDDARARVVLAHELAHISRHDWVVQLVAECLRAVHWYNPLLWIACARLRRESELACDDRVLDTGVEPTAYATWLMQFARHRGHAIAGGWSGAMPMARPPVLERRITAMLNTSANRTPLSFGVAAVAIAFAALVAVPGAVLRLQSAQAQNLEGSVYDASGAVLPEVALTLRDATDQTLTAFTDAEGHFLFPNVAAGTYVLEATLRGFKALKQEFTLADAKDWDRAVTLQVGTLQETISVRANRVAAGASAAAPAQPVRLRVGGNLRAPRKLVDVRPIYPASMREAGREGQVSVEAIVGVDGAVHSVRVLGAHVHPDFAIAASDAVRQWRFSPTLLNGEPIEVVMVVSIDFSLEG